MEIINSSQRALLGLKGTVVDETKNLIVIEREAEAREGAPSAQKEVKVPKVSSVFRFTVENGEKVDVDGRDIAFRPYERPKKV